MATSNTHDLRDLVASVEKAHGKGAIMRLGDDAGTEQIPVISSGCLALDEALGVGGYPRGRIIEVYGPESSGKTTLSLHAIAEVQKAGGLAAFIDAEHAFDLRYARAVGIDLSRLLVSQPDCGEQALDIAELLTRSGALDLIVIDSVAALVPKAEIDGDMGDVHMGLQARLMSKGLRKLASLTNRMDTTLIFINQLRQKIGVVFGSPETTPGGTALKYYSSVRLDVRRIGKVEAGDAVVGNRTRVRVVKNKVAPPFAEAEFDVRWGVGIDAATDLLDTALRCGVVEKNGSHLALDGKSMGQGRERVRQALLESAELRGALELRTLEQLSPRLRPTRAASTGPEASPAAAANTAAA
ncbi:MAG: recombinase RecA [Polyangiaceae bacterium]|nr:recombinase RecA [Polyangiaceae bacterium]